MDVDVGSTADSALSEKGAVKKRWTRPALATLNLTKTAGGDNPSDFELEFFIFSFQCEDPDNCIIITPIS